MTVRSHLAEIFRQGLWASLTGGWFYDPAQSLFCNTVHLYMWLVLLLLPLLFSLATAGSHFSWTFTSGYVIIIVVIFAVLKTIVWYIHGIFDKNDPILVTKGDSEAVGGHSRQLSIVTEGMRTDATSDDPGNEIEMVEFTTSRREQPPLSTSAPGIFSGGSAEDIAAIVPEVTKQTRRCVRIVDNNVCGGDMAVVADVHLRPRDSIKVEEEHNSEEDDRSSGPPSDKALLPNSGSSAIMIPADSLELLPIGTRRQSDADTRNKTAIPRKLSEPSFDAYQSANVRSRRARRQSSDSEQPARSVRRARSSLETANAKQRNRSQSFVLSQRTLDECKNTTRKSYPSKTSSTDIFLTSGLRSNQEQTDEFSSANSSGLKLTLDVAESAHYGGSDPVIVEENEPESSEKSANESQDEAEDAKNLEVFLENIREKMESMAGAQGDTPTAESEDSVSPSKQRSMTPDLAWLFRERDGSDASQRKDREGRPDRPVVDAQSPIPSTTLSPLRRQRAARGESEPRPGTSTGPTSSDAMDLKGEIARLLEELIEKHPETLEAIESVRQSRLGRSAGDSRRRHRYVSTEEPGRRRSERATSLEPPPAALIALSDLSMRGDTHVATNHEDTSQGAVHSFQDEDGNWFTYSFDELGVGTAQSLGSSRALMEILHAQPRQTLTALPEAGFTETESDDDAEMGKSQRDRRRNNSSSSNDSATYMAELPVSILHPSSATQASRDAPPFANVAARLRHAARRSGRDQSTAASRLQQMMERAVAAAAARQLGAGGTTVTSPGDYSSATLGISRSIQTSSMGSGSSLNRIRFLTDLTGMSAAGTSIDSRRVSAKRKYYYRLMLCPKLAPGKMFKLQLDRLRLLALFDRNASLRSAAFDVFMAALVSVLAAMLLSRGLFVDQWLVLFCFVVAGAQFSLLKSVQPDAASPIHGYNWLVAYGRPAYFCILAVVLLAVESDWWNHEEAWHSIAWAWNPYRFDSTALATKMAAVRDFIIGLILLLPVAFTIGLLPQVNTFLMHVLEQVDMHLFGGTASFGLLSAAYNLGKSVLSSALLFALCQTALNWAGESTQSVLFSAFCAVLVSLSYLLSRSSSSPALLWCAVHEFVRKGDVGAEKDTNELVDPLPGRLKDTVSVRLKHDLLMSTVGGLLMFGLHCTSVFTATQPYLHHCLVGVAVAFGFFNHYAFPQLRKQTPFKLVARPILKAHEYGQFETSVQAKLMFFEKVHVWMRLLERNIVYPTLVISALTLFGAKMTPKWLMPLILPVIGLRLLRGGFSHPQLVYIPLLGASLLLTLDLERFDIADYFPLCFYAFVVVWPKALELMLKLEFILAYIAPWQISWGSAFHAFAQPFSIPHSALTWMQAFLSSIISAPLNPFLGSSFFLTSYVRPVKFWEKDYNTRRVDHSNTRLITQIDRGPMMDDSNLNAVFYEHLTRSLQRSLAGDLELGRWATSVAPGDCFILASYYLNCLVHIIEVGNGFVTFQLRGLEFRGTYCHQREVEAISEDITEGTGCCCCEPGSLPGFLSLNTAWTLRWLAWEVTAAKYVVEGYSITDNSAVNLLQVHELRRLLVTLYVKCIIYYASMSPKLEEWLCTEAVTAALEPIMSNARFVDLDPMFCSANDEDYDMRLSGVSKPSFCDLYRTWIAHCVERRHGSSADPWLSASPESLLVSFCYALSLVGRRALGQAAHNRHANAAESFLYGLHALFKGDFRITSQRDEWVFADMDLLRCVIAPAVRMALKLHQDHFTAPDDFEDSASLFDRITGHESKLFISHEHDPLWRQAILANTPSLLALRHVFDDGQDDYKVIMLNRKYLNFRVIKLNRECVRAFWAGQQQELIFLRNRNPERGSIQNARQVLRNMINSSADQPIGYPIYVSPLTSSFVESHPQVGSVAGPPITLDLFWKGANRLWVWMRKHFGTSGSSNISLPMTAMGTMPARPAQQLQQQQQQQQSVVETPVRHMDDATPTVPAGSRVALAAVQSARASVGARGRPDQLQTHPIRRAHSHPLRRASPPDVAGAESLRRCRLTELKDSQMGIVKDAEESVVKLDADGTVRVTLHRKTLEEPATASAAAVEPVEEQPQYAEIIDIEHVFKCLDEPLKATGEPLVVWPNEEWRNRGGRSAWDWMPQVGMKGVVVHKWLPFHPERKFRSHAGVIYLLSVRDMSGAYVPIGESGLKFIHKAQYDVTNPHWEDD